MRLGKGQVNLWLVIITIGVASCHQNEQAQRIKLLYPTGQLRVLAMLRDSVLDGRVTGYRPTGSIMTTSQWVAGKRTGVTSSYYPAGTRQDSIGFLNDVRHGPAFTYYPNGALHTIEHYRHGVQTGIAVTFDSLGHKQEQFTYDQEGNEVYATFYNKAGKTAGGSPSSILVAKDTIQWGEHYSGSLRFGYSLRGKVTMLVGVLKQDRQALDRWPLIDTFQVIPQSKDGRFYFSYLPKQAGANAFQYKIIQPASPWNAPEPDSLSVDSQSSTRPFFVKNPAD